MCVTIRASHRGPPLIYSFLHPVLPPRNVQAPVRHITDPSVGQCWIPSHDPGVRIWRVIRLGAGIGTSLSGLVWAGSRSFPAFGAGWSAVNIRYPSAFLAAPLVGYLVFAAASWELGTLALISFCCLYSGLKTHVDLQFLVNARNSD